VVLRHAVWHGFLVLICWHILSRYHPWLALRLDHHRLLEIVCGQLVASWDVHWLHLTLVLAH
jgi:hypothetical protein